MALPVGRDLTILPLYATLSILDSRVAPGGVNLRLPARAAEDAVVARSGLKVMALEVGPQRRAQIVRRHRLPDGADVVPLALHREQRRAADCPRIDAAAAHGQQATGRSAGAVLRTRLVRFLLGHPAGRP